MDLKSYIKEEVLDEIEENVLNGVSKGTMYAHEIKPEQFDDARTSLSLVKQDPDDISNATEIKRIDSLYLSLNEICELKKKETFLESRIESEKKKAEKAAQKAKKAAQKSANIVGALQIQLTAVKDELEQIKEAMKKEKEEMKKQKEEMKKQKEEMKKQKEEMKKQKDLIDKLQREREEFLLTGDWTKDNGSLNTEQE